MRSAPLIHVLCQRGQGKHPTKDVATPARCQGHWPDANGQGFQASLACHPLWRGESLGARDVDLVYVLQYRRSRPTIAPIYRTLSP